MKVLEQDPKQDLIRLRVDTMDDLWHLYHLVGEGDRVTASTRRSPERQDDKIRPEKLPKQRMTLTVEVDDVEFHEYTDRLRIAGIITEGPQDHGSHHTFNVEPGDELRIYKTWKDHHLERIRDAVEATEEPEVIFVAVEMDEAAVAIMRQYGVREVTTIRARGLGKQGEGQPDRAAFFDEVLQVLLPLGGDELPVLVVGPGFAKEEFLEHVRNADPEATDHWQLDTTSQGGWPGIQEALNRGQVDRVSETARVAQETQAVEAFLSALGTDDPVAYGPDNVERALELGAVEQLLVTDDRVRAGEADAYMEKAKETGADVMTISTHHDAGDQLEGFGGIVARLRYRIE